MSQYKLLPALIKTYKDWSANNKRRSWLYCPVCHHDINGDDKSFIEDDGKYWWFKCARCGCKSKWYFHMMPYPIAHQVFTKQLKPAHNKQGRSK